MRVRIAILVLLYCTFLQPLVAQEAPPPRAITRRQRTPAEGGTTKSIGQPRSILWSFGAGMGITDMATETDGIGEFRVNAYGEALNGTIGAGGWLAEGYSQFRNADFSTGMRLSWKSQMTNFAGGADYNFMEQVFRGIFSYAYPIRRGGLFVDGSMARVDYITAPNRTVIFSIDKPFARRTKPGKAWPLSDMTRLVTDGSSSGVRRADSTSLDHLSAELRGELRIARETARNIQRLVVPWVDHAGGGRHANERVQHGLAELHDFASSGSGVDVDKETARFHDAIDRAFAFALIADGAVVKDSAATGRDIGNKARRILLTEVLYPYNFKLGQVKKDDTTLGLDDLASAAFLTWLHTQSGLSLQRHEAIASVFDTILEIVEHARAAARRETRTSRFVWLPLQYGLRLEERDTQQEIDAVLADATRQRFSAENHVEYVINEQFQNQLHRTILAARRYHVLWTHDFRGNNDARTPDVVGFQQVVRSYFAALTAAARAYDTTGTFPTYVILLDQWFYEGNNGRRWMNVLENPTEYAVRLPREFSDMEDTLRAARASLIKAIEQSKLLSEHHRLYGDDWLRNLVKVHVNITNPPDPSFWTWRLVKGLPIPDGWMRDHRKIVFYDLTEANPYSGEALLTGAGIGEKYVDDWEDRSLLACGPVALRLKSAARDVLLKQGMSAASIPLALQQVESADPLPTCQQHQGKSITTAAIQLQNGTGFDDKEINVGKAVLYTLMPKGSVIKIPDSIWNGTFWGSALIGAALRGVRVMVIAPAEANAPAKAFGSLARGHELLWRLVVASDVLRADFQRSGGSIRVGMFNSTLPVTDIVARLRALDNAMRNNAWLRELFPFADSSAIARLIPYLDSLSTANPVVNATPVAQHDRDKKDDEDSLPHPLLHLKANFLASERAWEVMKDSAWVDVMRQLLQQRILQMHQSSLRPLDVTIAPDSTIDLTNAALKRWMDDPARLRDSVVFYTVLGSANQNDRSMISDGEAAMVLSGWPALPAYIDLLMLIAQSEWITSPAPLDSLMPAQSALKTRIAHWFKHVF